MKQHIYNGKILIVKILSCHGTYIKKTDRWTELTSDIHLVFPVQGNFPPAVNRTQDHTGYAPQPTNGQGQREISPETSTPAPRKVCLNFKH